MAKKTKYSTTINNEEFANKTELENRVKAIKRSVMPRESITGQDRAFLVEFFESHPDWEEKLGVGVEDIYVDSAPPPWSSFCFWIRRSDGTEIDISYKYCLSPKGYMRSRIIKAMRYAVLDQIYAAKDEQLTELPFICPILGIECSLDEIHVDHAPPWEFATLVKCWREGQGLKSVEEIPIDPSVPHDQVDRLRPDLRTSWEEFHRERADLRLVSKQANTSTLRRGATTGRRALRAPRRDLARTTQKPAKRRA